MGRLSEVLNRVLLKERKARLWHADLRLWGWKNHTLTYEQRAAFYKQPLKDDFYDKSGKHKQFDLPYIYTVGADNGGWVRYQVLPAYLHGHRVDLVHHLVCVNESEPLLKIWSGNFHCINCGLMGSAQTLKDYLCNPVKTEVCNDPQTKSTYCANDKTVTKRSS